MEEKQEKFMIVKSKPLTNLLEKLSWTVWDFAAELGISVTEASKLVLGEKVGCQTAWSFISYFKANVAHEFIDWETMDMDNPYHKIKKMNIRSRSFRQSAYAKRKAKKCIMRADKPKEAG